MSKQERIRLNQQRSRTEKKEYIQSVKKRVEDNHSKYREAKLQFEACEQLRKENQKLRALLDSQGVSNMQIDLLINIYALDYATEQIFSRSVHPKLQLKTISVQAALSARLDAAGNQILLTAASTSSPLVLSGRNSDTDDPYLTSSSTFEFQQPQYCYVFHTCFNPTMQATPNNSMLCSEAHELIDQSIQHNRPSLSAHRFQTGFRLGDGNWARRGLPGE